MLLELGQPVINLAGGDRDTVVGGAPVQHYPVDQAGQRLPRVVIPVVADRSSRGRVGQAAADDLLQRPVADPGGADDGGSAGARRCATTGEGNGGSQDGGAAGKAPGGAGHRVPSTRGPAPDDVRHAIRTVGAARIVTRPPLRSSARGRRAPPAAGRGTSPAGQCRAAAGRRSGRSWARPPGGDRAAAAAAAGTPAAPPARTGWWPPFRRPGAPPR